MTPPLRKRLSLSRHPNGDVAVLPFGSSDVRRLPSDPAFDYARTKQMDYFAEVYAIALSRPDWLHDVLPAAQLAWLKKNVFWTDRQLRQALDEVVRGIASRGPLADQLRAQAASVTDRVVTKQQALAALRALASNLQRQSTPSGAPIA